MSAKKTPTKVQAEAKRVQPPSEDCREGLDAEKSGTVTSALNRVGFELQALENMVVEVENMTTRICGTYPCRDSDHDGDCLEPNSPIAKLLEDDAYRIIRLRERLQDAMTTLNTTFAGI